MRGLNKFSPSFFDKYRTTPVRIHPYSPKQARIARKIIFRVKEILAGYQIDYLIRGSTAFKIAGKGDVEVGIYPKSTDWLTVLRLLEGNFGPPENLETNYARFNSLLEDKEIEIIILRSHEAKVDTCLHRYLPAHPPLLREYEAIKRQYSFSKREYQRAKHTFLSRVIDEIPPHY